MKAATPDTPGKSARSTPLHASVERVIPRKIHYVWFGGRAMPDAMKALVDDWRRLMPDHEICEWNETNIDVASHPFMQRMHRERKYAFASDYARLMVLRDHGGIYLDTDIRIKKSLSPFEGEQCFWSFEFDHFISTAIIGCRPGHPLVHALLKQYDGRESEIVNNILVTRFFIDTYPEFRLNNRDQIIGGDIRIFPKEYFIVPTFQKSTDYSVHLANNQWKPASGRPRFGKVVRAVIGDVMFYKLVNIQMGLSSDFPAMEKARRRK